MRRICIFVPAVTPLAHVPGLNADARPPTRAQRQAARVAGTAEVLSRRTVSKPLPRSIGLAGTRAGAGALTPVGPGGTRQRRLARPMGSTDSVGSRS